MQLEAWRSIGDNSPCPITDLAVTALASDAEYAIRVVTELASKRSDELKDRAMSESCESTWHELLGERECTDTAVQLAAKFMSTSEAVCNQLRAQARISVVTSVRAPDKSGDEPGASTVSSTTPLNPAATRPVNDGWFQQRSGMDPLGTF